MSEEETLNVEDDDEDEELDVSDEREMPVSMATHPAAAAALQASAAAGLHHHALHPHHPLMPGGAPAGYPHPAAALYHHHQQQQAASRNTPAEVRSHDQPSANDKDTSPKLGDGQHRGQHSVGNTAFPGQNNGTGKPPNTPTSAHNTHPSHSPTSKDSHRAPSPISHTPTRSDSPPPTQAKRPRIDYPIPAHHIERWQLAGHV